MPGQSSTLFDIPFWGRGFRPFFLLGAIYAVMTVLAWALFLQDIISVPIPWGNNPALWHAHEMIYGFTVAIIAGFLLTAVANWTGSAPVRRGNLAFLCIVWLAGRATFWGDYSLSWISSAVDLAFLPLLAVSLSIPLIRTGNRHNFMFLGVLMLLFLGNLHMHLEMNDVAGGDPRMTAYAVVMIVMSIISIVSSRIIPSFTVAGLRIRGLTVYQTVQQKTDIAAMLLLMALAIFILIWSIDSTQTGVLSLGAGLLHLWRMRFWHTFKTGCEPMLWILHAGHLWLVAGLLVLALHGFGFIGQPSLGLHILTVGSIGSMTLGMMVRVALGHTGRQIVAGNAAKVSFGLMQGAAVVRSIAIIIQDDNYYQWITASGALWAGAFVIYLAVYAPLLLGPRPDGAEA